MQGTHLFLTEVLFALSVLFDLGQKAALKTVFGQLSSLYTHHAAHLNLVAFYAEKLGNLIQIILGDFFEMLWWASA